MILGTWGVANMVTDGFYQNKMNQEQYYFQRTNVIWNSINVALAGAGLLFLKEPSGSINLGSIKATEKRLQRTWLINAFLDIGYVAAAAVLYKPNSAQNEGIFKSVAIQSAFLFTFDTSLFLYRRHYVRKRPYLK